MQPPFFINKIKLSCGPTFSFPIIVRVGVSVAGSHGNDSVVAGLQISCCNESRLVALTLDIQRELHTALLTEVHASAVLHTRTINNPTKLH